MVVLGVVLATAMAGLVAGWGRVRGGRTSRVAQRVGLLSMVQVSTLLLVAAGLNNYGYFYGSWSDLFGNGARQDNVVARVAEPAHGPRSSAASKGVARVRLDAVPISWSTPGQYATRGEVLRVVVPGPRAAITAPAYVYLPPQYFLRINKHRLFPGVEVFTGYPGYALGLVNRLDDPQVLLNAMAAHTAGPMILVMIDPAVAPPRDTECTNVPAGPQTLTYLAQDVPTYLAGLFRIRPLGWGAMGDSTGGYCATKIALTTSNVFSAVVSLSGYYHAISDATTGSLWGRSTVLEDLNSPDWLLQHQPPPPVAILATIGSDERGAEGVVDTHRFLALVRAPMTAQEVVVAGGGHNFSDWSRVLPRAMAFLWLHLRA